MGSGYDAAPGVGVGLQADGSWIHDRTGRRWASKAMAIQMDGPLMADQPKALGTGQTGILVQTGEYAGNTTGLVEPMQVNYAGGGVPISIAQFLSNPPTALTPQNYGVNPAATTLNHPLSPVAPNSPVSGAGSGSVDVLQAADVQGGSAATPTTSTLSGLITLPMILGSVALLIIIWLFFGMKSSRSTNHDED